MPVGFCLMKIVIPTSGIRMTGLEFETHSTRTGGRFLDIGFNASRAFRDMD